MKKEDGLSEGECGRAESPNVLGRRAVIRSIRVWFDLDWSGNYAGHQEDIGNRLRAKFGAQRVRLVETYRYFEISPISLGEVI